MSNPITLTIERFICYGASLFLTGTTPEGKYAVVRTAKTFSSESAKKLIGTQLTFY